MNFSMFFMATSILCYDPTININFPAKLELVFFLGTPRPSRVYVCFNPHDNKIYFSRHVPFDETHFLYKEKKIDFSILGTPLEQFNSTPQLTLTASILPPNSIVPSSSSTLSSSSIDSLTNNNSIFLLLLLQIMLVLLQTIHLMAYQPLLSHHNHLGLVTSWF